jgi:hypothetical protein
VLIDESWSGATQIQERAREANRLHKALEDTEIKLDCVASDILGKSGRAMRDAQITGLSDAIGEQIAPFEQAVELLCTIPSVQRRTAEVIIAEIGVDMSVFPTDKQLASWAGMCPSATTNPPASDAPAPPAKAPSGWSGRSTKPPHSIICACWHMLSTGELYTDLGGDYFRKRDPERITKRLIAQLEALGHHVTLEVAA